MLDDWILLVGSVSVASVQGVVNLAEHVLVSTTTNLFHRCQKHEIN